MSAGLLLAIDQGTTNTKAMLVDRFGDPVFRASRPLSLLQPKAGYVEQDPWALWDSVVSVARDCVRHVAVTGNAIEGIALSTQRETALTWTSGTDRHVETIGQAISWQCRRSSDICEHLADMAMLLRDRSGLPLDPLISASKWAWVLNEYPRLLRGEDCSRLRFGNVDAWLVWQLTGGSVHATDHTNASRTGLLNLTTLQWDQDLLDMFGVPLKALPSIRASVSEFGRCTSIEGLQGVPIVSVIGDSHAAMAGHGNYGAGAVKATYGTGSSLMALTPRLAPPTASLARTIAWSSPHGIQYALEGNIAMAGAAVHWVGEFLGLSEPAAGTAELAATVRDAAGMVFVPAQVGLGAPYWDTVARGAIVHIERSHKAAHLARAAVDAIAHQVADVFAAMEEACEAELPSLQADGGATRNAGLMQFQADVLGRPVLRSLHEELSAIGAALLGGLQLGWWKSFDDLAKLAHRSDAFLPAMSEMKRLELRAGWSQAVRRVRLAEKEAHV